MLVAATGKSKNGKDYAGATALLVQNNRFEHIIDSPANDTTLFLLPSVGARKFRHLVKLVIDQTYAATIVLSNIVDGSKKSITLTVNGVSRQFFVRNIVMCEELTNGKTGVMLDEPYNYSELYVQADESIAAIAALVV